MAASPSTTSRLRSVREKFTGLWRHPDFLRLWAGQTVSVFGSMITGTALPFTAILALDARPLEVAILAACGIVPGLVIGLAAGVWVDRLRRRPVMIAMDLGRALVLLTVPLAYVFDALTIWHLYAVAFAAGSMTLVFDVAYQAYLPSLVRQDQLVEGNSKLSASNSVAEFSGFSASGALVHIASGPFAILIDAFTFLGSAASLSSIRRNEPPPALHDSTSSVRSEAIAGLKLVAGDARLRSIALAAVLYSAGLGTFGGTYMLFVTRTLGFDPAVLGVIFGLGGISSLFGALLAGRAASAFGVGRAMTLGVLMMGGSMLFIPMAQGATVAGATFLILQQITGDGAFTAYDVNQVSLRQSITPERALGRVNSCLRITELGFVLVGTLGGGLIGEYIGLRHALFGGALLVMLGAGALALSPIFGIRSIESVIVPVDDAIT